MNVSLEMSKLVRFVTTIVCWLACLPCGLMFALPPPAGSSAQSHYERPSTKGGPYNKRVVVFVHGIFGDADGTWRYSPAVYWPRLLLADEAFRDSDVYVASYSSPYFGNTMNVDEVVTNLNNRLVQDDVFSKHREVVFVCHSLGGLIVQRLLLTFRDYAHQVPFIYFFSTPETGAQIANLASVFSSDPLLRGLIPGDGNDYLQNLENEWKAAQFHIYRFCAYEKKKYKGVLVVDRLSGTRNCDDPPLAINEDHVSIVKPDSVDHDSYVALRNAFRRYPVAIGKLAAHGTPPDELPHAEKSQAKPLSPPTQQAAPPSQSVQTTEKPPQFNFYVNDGSVEDSYFSGVGINVGDPNTQLHGTVWQHNFVDESSWFQHLEAMKALGTADAINPRFLGMSKKVFSILTSSEMTHLLVYVEIENKGQPGTISNWLAEFGISPSAKTIKGTPITKDLDIRDSSGRIVNSVLGKADGTAEITSDAALAQSKMAHGWIDFYIADAALISDLRYKTVRMVITCHDDRGTAYVIAQGDHQPIEDGDIAPP
jgi:pimeloyl-ACP methyl ester carboxylesterase